MVSNFSSGTLHPAVTCSMTTSLRSSRRSCSTATGSARRVRTLRRPGSKLTSHGCKLILLSSGSAGNGSADGRVLKMELAQPRSMPLKTQDRPHHQHLRLPQQLLPRRKRRLLLPSQRLPRLQPARSLLHPLYAHLKETSGW